MYPDCADPTFSYYDLMFPFLTKTTAGAEPTFLGPGQISSTRHHDSLVLLDLLQDKVAAPPLDANVLAAE